MVNRRFENPAIASGSGTRLRRGLCFQSFARSGKRRRLENVQPPADPAAAHGFNLRSVEGADHVRHEPEEQRVRSKPRGFTRLQSLGLSRGGRTGRGSASPLALGLRSPSVLAVCVRTEPLVLSRAWIWDERFLAGETEVFGNHCGCNAKAERLRSATREERATRRRSGSEEGRTVFWRSWGRRQTRRTSIFKPAVFHHFRFAADIRLPSIG